MPPRVVTRQVLRWSERASSPWWKSRVAPRRARRPAGKARRWKIPGVFDGGATPPGGMHRSSNAAGLPPRAASSPPCAPGTRDEARTTRDELASGGGQVPAVGDGQRPCAHGSEPRGLDVLQPAVDSAQMERISPLRILGVATVFGIFSALQAYNYVKLMPQWTT